jgi:3-oxoadipate CoA-transferase, beta subunit
MSLDKDQIAARIAADIAPGSYVNLGIGQPTLVANYLQPGSGVVLHTENGRLGMGPLAHGDEVDADSPTPGSSRSPSCRARRTSTTSIRSR